MTMASPPLVSLLIIALTSGIFVLDLFTPLGWADGFLYLIPMMLILFRSPHHHHLVGFAALCSALIILGWLFSPPGGAAGPVTYNRTIGITLLWVTALFLRHRKQVEETLESRVQERTADLQNAINFLEKDIIERKRAEEALRQSEERLRLLMGYANDAILYINLNGTIQWVSHHAEVVTGRPSDELIGRPIMALLSSHAAALAEARLAAVRQGQAVPALVELEFLRPDGVPVVAEGNIASVQEQGRVVGRLLVARDITERKRVEQVLRESEQRMRAILAGALDAVVGIDTEGIVTYWNPRSEAIFGWTRSEAVGRKMADMIIPPQHREAHELGLRHFLATGSGPVLNRRIEITALRRDRTEFPVELAISVSKSDDSYQFTAFIADITERKRAEETLVEMNVALTNAMPGISSLDSNGRYLKVNGDYARMVGYDAREMIGMDPAATIFPNDRNIAVAAYQRMLNEGKAEFEVRAIRKDGSMFPKHVLIVKRLDKAGKFIGHHCCMRDITERKRAEEVLRESGQRLSQLLEDRERISRDLHDNIIQMLYAIGLGLEDCQRLLGKGSKKVGQAISHAISDLNAVIRDVRSYIAWSEPKISDGRQLKFAIERLARTMEGTQLLHFRLKIDQAAADRLTPEEASNVLYIAREAMSNSLRHSQARDGTVVLEARDGKICLVVADVGEGFDTADTGKYGQGLHNIAARAKKLDARLRIVSEPGLGVRIMVDIPMVRQRVPAGV